VPTPRRKKPAVKKPPGRTRQRVTEDEGPTRQIRQSAADKQRKVSAAVNIVDGEVMVTGQVSETVPVAQYANVVILAGLQWKLGGIHMEDLVDVDWGDIDDDEDSESYGTSTFDYESLTPAQQAAYDRVMGARRATMKVLEHGSAEDRETVERSVRMSNEREAKEEAEAQKAEKAVKAKKRAATR
jgi:hypothetical protein